MLLGKKSRTRKAAEAVSDYRDSIEMLMEVIEDETLRKRLVDQLDISDAAARKAEEALKGGKPVTCDEVQDFRVESAKTLAMLEEFMVKDGALVSQ